jgi:transposase
VAPFYSSTGRPSIDPELMLRMLILGYVFAIRSERQICAEVQVNLAYRWFCRLSIEDAIPNHSVFSRARHERFRESDVLRRVFERIVGASIAAGLVGGAAFSVDASLIKADVNKRERASGEAAPRWQDADQASRAVREYIANVYICPAGKELTHSARVTARAAISSHAARRPRPERFLAISMKMSETTFALSRVRRHSRNHVWSARRSRCASRGIMGYCVS